MKAPDKIYLQRVPSNQEVIDGWTVEPVKHTVLEDIEYIRKDALLKFLKKKVNEIEIAMETGADDTVLWGQRNAFKQVIDKINSM